MGDLSVAISTMALIFSGLSTILATITAFYTFVRRARVRMTRPTFVAFAFDGTEMTPKIFTRTLLFATKPPGKVVEAMFARVKQGDKVTTYTFWSYDVDGRLVPGGGLFVGTEGIVTNHHFVLRKGTARQVFTAGPVTVEFCARGVGQQQARQLHEVVLSLSDEQAAALNQSTAGVFFESCPESGAFHGVLDAVPPGLRRRA